MGGLFKQPKIPKTPPPVPMPEEATLNAAKRRKFAMMLKRSGRNSTILSDDTMGG